MQNDLLYQIALTQIPKVGPITAKTLISYCGSPRLVFEANKKKLLSIPGIGPHVVNHILSSKVFDVAEKEMALIEANEIEIISYLDKKYPIRLKQIADAPILIYRKGKGNLNLPRTIGIVGTRTPSSRGKLLCKELVQNLKKYQVQIVSGMAYGIDIIAHQTALECDLPTFGVMANGLGMVYPSHHHSIGKRLQKQGSLISEYLFHTEPEKHFFPQRNRIIAGLIDLLIVVETKRRGGSMITAEIAYEHNRDVVAMPGRTYDKLSKGCHHLIKTHRASLVESAEDIAYLMGWEVEIKEPQPLQIQSFSPDQQKVILHLSKDKPQHIDYLHHQVSLNEGSLATLLLEMELEGIIKTLPGKQYILS